MKTMIVAVARSIYLGLARPLLHVLKYQASKIRIRQLLGMADEIYLEVGSGDKKGVRGWTTLDKTKNCDIFWDLRNGIPFPAESITKIYSSHFLEHLSYDEGQKFLDECLRTLRPGGVFSICVPNARIYIEAYLGGLELDPALYCGYRPAFNNTTKMDYVNYTSYMDGHHKYMFDKENLLFILEKKGFRNVESREFDPQLDSRERDFESIYATARK